MYDLARLLQPSTCYGIREAIMPEAYWRMLKLKRPARPSSHLARSVSHANVTIGSATSGGVLLGVEGFPSLREDRATLDPQTASRLRAAQLSFSLATVSAAISVVLWCIQMSLSFSSLASMCDFHGRVGPQRRRATMPSVTITIVKLWRLVLKISHPD